MFAFRRLRTVPTAYNGNSSFTSTPNDTNTYIAALLCCQVEAWSIPIQVWYSESIEVTVATIYVTYVFGSNITISTIESILSADYTPTTTGFGGQGSTQSAFRGSQQTLFRATI